MTAMQAWLMVGQSRDKKRERRARWMAEVVEPGGPLNAQIKRAKRVFMEELKEDAN